MNLLTRLKRGAALGGICAVVTFVILFLFRSNLTLGAVIAALTVICVYFILGRLL
jgi:hypothetical protein